MNNATETRATRHSVAPGLLRRAQEQAGIASDNSFARLLNVDAAELAQMRDGGELTIRGLVGIAEAFGTPLQEIVASRPERAVAA